jgi:phosphosulfolactate synthase
MPASNFDLGLKRDGGLTHVLDKGLGSRAWEDVLESAGDYIDIVKLGWGTSYITGNLERKLEVLKEKPVVIGGTFFEVVYAKDAIDEYKRWLTELGLTHVEISDGTIDIPRERKLQLIADFARDFTVLSEVGSKDSDVVFAPYQWVQWLKEEKEAGAWKVITEARETGSAGIFRKDGDMRTGLIEEIAHELDVDDLVWEAPTKASQAWFVKHFGPGVNLGNIPPEEVIPLETLRLGLRGDTLKEVLLAGEPLVSPRAPSSVGADTSDGSV